MTGRVTILDDALEAVADVTPCLYVDRVVRRVDRDLAMSGDRR